MTGAEASGLAPMRRTPGRAATPVARVEQGLRLPAGPRPLASSVPLRSPMAAPRRDPSGPMVRTRRPAHADPTPTALRALEMLPHPQPGWAGGERPPSTPRPPSPREEGAARRAGPGRLRGQRLPARMPDGLRPAPRRRSSPPPSGSLAVGWREIGRVSAGWTAADSPAAPGERQQQAASRGPHQRHSWAERPAWLRALRPAEARVGPSQSGAVGPRASAGRWAALPGGVAAAPTAAGMGAARCTLAGGRAPRRP